MRFDVVSAWTIVQKKGAAVFAVIFGIVACSPMFTAHAAGRVAPTSSGTDWIVMDMSTGRVVSEQGARTERYPASLTKLMTLDLAFQELSAGRLTLDTLIPVSAAAARVQRMKLDLLPGQKITMREAILGMTTLSANDAATALGEYLGGGSVTKFAQAMTDHARALGMLHTSFRNPSGLPNPGQVVDAYDMAILTRHILLTYPQYRYFFSVQSFNFEGRTIPNLDGMLKCYPGAIGMKTGFTDAARFNVVTAAERDGHLLIGVELHARSWSTAYGTMARLLDAGFASEEEPANLLAANHGALPDADAVTTHPYAARRGAFP
ncbi:D-alanyl-D-alanine carboxypeptidase family protein [Paraburkholderia dilworthii]|uniref:D-alanyl-D-alanine carboxypeptidase family protein n=1 Tax=Paraburkholderia dilworthii TaxID=948106 RepID=UPI001ADF5D9B|nr:D-alanyl-D-alanine carboxypeptidase family protein [Paraburkholderia dilworthii]